MSVHACPVYADIYIDILASLWKFVNGVRGTVSYDMMSLFYICILKLFQTIVDTPGYGQYSTARVCQDANIITSQGPGTCFEFALLIVELLCGKELAQALAEPMIISPSQPWSGLIYKQLTAILLNTEERDEKYTAVLENISLYSTALAERLCTC